MLNINYPVIFWFLVTVKQGIKKRVRRIGNSNWVLRALFLRLFRWFQFDVFAPGQIHDFRVTARDVGEPLLVTLKKDGGSFDPDWFVDRLTIKKLGKNPGILYDFPCNRWVQNESVTIFEGKGKPWVLNNILVTNTEDGFFLNHALQSRYQSLCFQYIHIYIHNHIQQLLNEVVYDMKN